MIKPVRDRLVRLLEFATASLMGILVIDVTWQVVSRFLVRKPSAWTEELATILMIWASLLGAALAYAKKMHLGVDYFVGLLSAGRRALVALYVHLLVAGFAGYIMVYGGLRIVQRTLAVHQMTPALGLDRGYVYLALPIAGLFMLLFAVEAIAEEIRTLRKGGELT
jgi:TRAP-type C4-dicarboxylate transport system permease small subunit